MRSEWNPTISGNDRIDLTGSEAERAASMGSTQRMQ